MANTTYGAKYKKLFSRLDKTHFFSVYGQKNEWLHTPNCYRGFIKSDGLSLIKTMNKCGVTLILHAPDHYLGHTPTARIFEAAAASTVIISDKNPFVERNFGDSVLYIDHEKTSDEIFDQINNHMKWITANPEEAKNLARRSHEIFIKKFTLEAQLLKLLDLHKDLIEADSQITTQESTLVFTKK
jgi:spore maturation protein CgeB